MVRYYAPSGDMQEIDGWTRPFYTLEGHQESILEYDKPLLPESTDLFWVEAKARVARESNNYPKVNSLTFENRFDDVSFESSSAAGYGYVGRKGEGDNFKRAKRIANASIRLFNEDIIDQGIAKAKEPLA
ncbi:hypothetical protein AMTR_s00098p00121330 [Amborella trichopoda]|uniref:RNA-directed RNA polymerase C-terminal domain-containing protein n=1 Tax=Amborella trichopoda TaxID=13333 RepID=W1NYT3_AMBTC|nr:hypothetical protein AMTR_s00098p00121330 [Amborella trichopoda]